MRPGVCFATLVLWVVGSGALAAPAPPGGHHPLFYGGNNRAGYPPLNATTSVPENHPAVGSRLQLRASPNPFTDRVHLSCVARTGEAVSVRIYSPAGRLIRRLASTSATGGPRQLLWDGRDGRGRTVGPGIYFVRAEAGNRVETLRIARLR